MKTMCIETNPLSSSTPPHTRAHSSPHTCRLLCCSAPLSSSPTPHPHHTHISPTLQPPIVIHRHPPSPIHQPLTLNHSPSPTPQPLTLTHSPPLLPTLTHPHPTRIPPSLQPHPTAQGEIIVTTSHVKDTRGYNFNEKATIAVGGAKCVSVDGHSYGQVTLTTALEHYHHAGEREYQCEVRVYGSVQ